MSPRRLVLLGHPVGHSLSPIMQNAAIAAAGLDAQYEARDVPPAGFDDAIAALRGAAERVGGNATTPHKAALARACDRRTAVADRAGAVNTFWFEGGTLVGDNTDAGGFIAAATALMGGLPEGVTFGILGAGGATAGVLTAIEQLPGARVLLHARTPARAEALAARFGSVVQLADAARIVAEAHCVVNATPLGTTTEGQPIAVDGLRPEVRLFDLGYRIGGTAWVRAAQARGLAAIDGLPMLVEQGALSFERWFGQPADRSAMWAALRAVDPTR